MHSKNKVTSKPLLTNIFFVLISIVASVATADDTEVFFSINTSKPNLLFVLDNSGSMNWDLDGNKSTSSEFSPPTRLSVLKDAVSSVLLEAPDNVNVGLMHFGPGNNGNEWSTTNESWRTHGVNGVSFPLTDINALAREVIPTESSVYNLPYYPSENETVRHYVSEVVNGWEAVGGTPLVDVIYEASLYYRGENMRYGYDNPDGATGVGAHPSSYLGAIVQNDISISARDYSLAPKYKSPIVSSCQANYIVLMTDGDPTYYYYDITSTQNDMWGTSRGPLAEVIRQTAATGTLASYITSCEDKPSGYSAGKCGPELTRYIADNDNSSAYNDKQTIKTYTIGFGANLSASAQDYLKSLETIDDDPETDVIEDGYFSATKPEDLAAAFKKILSEVAEPKGTLASPGYTVNVKNGLEHDKNIYIPVFVKEKTSRWAGNLKKFSINDVDGKRVIQGKNNKNAVDELGGFTEDAWDEWSTNEKADGNELLKGGVAEKLTDPTIRKLYSNLSSGDQLIELKSDLTTSVITNEVLGIPEGSTDEYRKKIINFIRGWRYGEFDANQTPNGIVRKHMGDMLHSEPYVYTYPNGEQYIFVATNEGFIHAFNTETGEEKFAFMPKELLKNIEPQLRNEGTLKDHLYGIDGAINVWSEKGDDLDSVESVYLYFGMRRGGRSYYALNITNINNPSLEWKVTASDSDFSSMGQSWSVPYLGNVGYGSTGKTRAAIIISGGYDPVEDRDVEGEKGLLDDSTKSVETTMGNDMFIIDAKTGEKIWSLQDEFGDSIIQDSIPGGLRYLDTNYNNIIDRIYFADTGGNIWRLELSEKLTSGESKLIKLASLGGTGVDARKFYNEPDVAVMKLKGKLIFIISIGSGFRAHPLDKEINDEFFMLVDTAPYRPIDEDNYEAIKRVDLATIQISDSGNGASIELTGSIVDNDKRGWRVTFPEQGEKVLSTSIAFDGVMTFATTVPDALLTGVGIDPCAAPIVQGRFYGINILTGKAGLYLNQLVEDSGELHGQGDGGDIPDINVRSLPISKEPPGAPQIVFNELEINATTGECKHPVDIRIGKKLSQVTGYNACRLESVYWSNPVKK